MRDETLLDALHEAADGVGVALGSLANWGPSGQRESQYHSDLAADEVVLDIAERLGVGVLSEEAGVRHLDRDLVLVVDPLDGSTNASYGLPWYATSLCIVDADGPRVALVRNQANGENYAAVRGAGATLDGEEIVRGYTPELAGAVLGLADLPPRRLGWGQYRCYGAAALDISAVAHGRLDGYVDCGRDAHGVWDYLAGALVCHEAGSRVVDAFGRELCVLDHDARRTPIAAGNAALLDELVGQRRSFEHDVR